MRAQDVLELVTNDIVIEIMDENGSPLFKRTIDGRTQQECLWFKTICHGGDSSKLCYFTQTKEFYCYTNCGKMSFFDLIKKILGYGDKDFAKCVQYVANKVGYRNTNRVGLGGPALSETVKQYLKAHSGEKTQLKATPNYFLKAYDDTILNYFDINEVYEGWVKEGISKETLWNYQIEWYEYEKYIIIPHYDIDNRLVGIRRRSLKPEDSNNKYMPLFIEGRSYEHALGLNLYGIHKNKDYISKIKEVVLVEGEKSVLMGDTFFGEKNKLLATCGFSVSDYQMKLLKRLGVRVVYLGFDKDFDLRLENEYEKDPVLYQNFEHYKHRISTLAQRLNIAGFTVKIIRDLSKQLAIKDSPTDKGKAVFENLMKNATIYRNENIL